VPAAADTHDVVIAGASLAGCSAATLLARGGARVALVERAPDAGAFKRMCSHFIQSSAVGAMARTGALAAAERRGAVRSRIRVWTRWGWIEPSPRSTLPPGVNLRREVLDPLVREIAAETPGVDLLLGHTVEGLVWSGGRVAGVEARVTGRAAAPAGGRASRHVTLRAPLVVGADGRGSKVAALAGVRRRAWPHGRIAYGAYYDGSGPAAAPHASAWLLDPDWAAAFPTDGGLTFYGAMPRKERLDAFRADPPGALEAYVGALPDAPPIDPARRVSPVLGKVDMTNVAHAPVAPGLALIGDAALAADPLWGVGCGWAFQSADWLAEAVAGALAGEEALDAGLGRYRRRHRRGLREHMVFMNDYATGRRFAPLERLMFAAGARDERVAVEVEAVGSRARRPTAMAARAVPRALVVQGRAALRARRLRRSGAPAGMMPAA
jgi:2-polyprenyl-6-methoxyphenol hydroxylase-like FAD-dependent oxidoreductase